MGYEVTRFIGETDEEFYCSICSMVMENPVLLPCEHAFCSKCITTWLEANSSCPVADRESVTVADIKPPGRSFHNLLNKLEIKCDFYPEGCRVTVKLEHLDDHRTGCVYNPNSEIICDKECKMKMSRHEYQGHNCLKHLTDRASLQDEKIVKLKQELNGQQEHFERIINRQKEQISHQQDEINKLNEEVSRQQKENTKLNDKLAKVNISRQQGIATVDDNSNMLWQKTVNMKISDDQPNILEAMNESRAFAKSFYSLGPKNPSFKVQILKQGLAVIGLTSLDHPMHASMSAAIGCYEDSIGFSSCGSLFVARKKDPVGSHWNTGDIIECSIKFPQNFIDDVSKPIEVNFLRNGRKQMEVIFRMPSDGLFPTIQIDFASAKIKYSTN